MAWAHYVAWMRPEETSMLAERYLDPVAFDVGKDPKRDEVAAALDCGFDGWFVDVVARKDHGLSHHSDLGPLLTAAEGTEFQVGVCLDVKTDVTWQVSELVRILKTWGGHPNYPRVGTRYVVATYTWWQWTAQEWMAIRAGCEAAGYPLYLIGNLTFAFNDYSDSLLEKYADAFDAGYTFGYIGRNGMTVDENHRRLAAFCQSRGKRWMPGIHPGYLGGWYWGRNAYYLPIEGVDTLQNGFLASYATTDHGSWVHFTSWNDHDETTLFPRLLTTGLRPLLREYTAALKRLPPQAEKTDVLFAYHREELPGTVLRIEAMRLPAREPDPTCVVSGRLLDADGRIVAELPPKALTSDWCRAEWLLDTIPLAKRANLTPVFEKSGHEARFPAIFFSEPWIRNQQTIRETFSTRVPVKSSYAAFEKDGTLQATVGFTSPVPLKRAVLYVDDLAAGVFHPSESHAAKETQFSFVVSGPKGEDADFYVDVKNVREHVRTRRQVKRHEAHKVSGSADMMFVLTAHGVNRCFAPRELLTGEGIHEGAYRISAAADQGVYHSEPIGLTEGALSLRAFHAPLRPTDACWIRFETIDGRVAESRVKYPLSTDRERTPRLERILRSEITLEHPQGGKAGRPGAIPFLDVTKSPVKGVKSVRALVSPLASRRLTRKEAMSFSGDGKDLVNLLPHRSWPMDKGVISFELNPDASCATQAVGVISKVGWQSGFAFSLLSGGRMRAIWREMPAGKGVVVKAGAHVRYGEWNVVRLAWDGETARLEVNGHVGAAVAIPARRQYGNCYVTFGGAGAGEIPLAGSIRNVKVQNHPPEVAIEPSLETVWQTKIDEVSASGGGVVTVPSGVHRVGELWLRNGVTLHLDKGAVLVGHLAATNAIGIALEGEGAVDGEGTRWPRTPVEHARPRLIHLMDCRDVRIEGVTLRNSARWTLYLDRVDGFLVKNVTIDAHANLNNDGIDIKGRNGRIEDCAVSSSDDAIVFKCQEANYVVENVVVRRCRLSSHTNAIKIGTETFGTFRNILVEDCTVRTDRPAEIVEYDPRTPGLCADVPASKTGIAVEVVDGGVIDGVRIRNVDITSAQTPVFVRQGRRHEQSDRPSVLRNVVIENVRAVGTSWIACSVTGVPGLRPSGIVIRNVSLSLPGGCPKAAAERDVPENEKSYPTSTLFDYHPLPASGFYVRHADRIVLENVTFEFRQPDERPSVVYEDATK